MPTCAEVLQRFFAPDSLAGFLPAIGSGISFWPAAPFFGLLVPGFDTRSWPTLRRSASNQVSTTLLAATSPVRARETSPVGGGGEDARTKVL